MLVGKRIHIEDDPIRPMLRHISADKKIESYA